MYNVNAKLQVSKVVQENLEIKIKNWEKCSSEDSFYFCAYGDEATSIDHKWRPFCNEHGGNISGVSMCFHFVCRYMKFGLRTCNFTNNDLYQSNFSRILLIISGCNFLIIDARKSINQITFPWQFLGFNSILR